MHARAVVITEPLEIFLRVGGQNGAFKLTVHWSIAAAHKHINEPSHQFTLLHNIIDWFTASNSFETFKCYWAHWTLGLYWLLVFCEVQMSFDVQESLFEEGQSFDLVLLTLIKHLLHALHVLRCAFGQLLQRLLILLSGLWHKHTQYSRYWKIYPAELRHKGSV